MTKRNEPAQDAVPMEPVAKKQKKRSPARVAAAAFDRHAKLTEQIERAQAKVAEWTEERDGLAAGLEDDARVVFERMVGDA